MKTDLKTVLKKCLKFDWLDFILVSEIIHGKSLSEKIFFRQLHFTMLYINWNLFIIADLQVLAVTWVKL